ncbi:MAG: cohesin domain-containing protein [bacterium]|nr:cohesin domain-containing protein [bacterium]
MDTPASLSLGPTSISASQGDQIPVDLLIYSGNNKTISTDAYITYDPQILEITTQIDGGDLFQSVGVKQITPGKAYVYGINLDLAQAKPMEGNVARIYFQAISSGTTKLQIDCVPFSEKTSQIVSQKEELTNIIHCDSTRTHTSTVTISGDNVLGTSTENMFGLYKWHISAAVLVAVLTATLYIRYRNLTKQLKST